MFDLLNAKIGCAGYEWTPSLSARNPTDITSGVVPNRPIRPLPKRRIRSRLSDDQANSIDYPSSPSASTPLFGFAQSDPSPRFDQHPQTATAQATARARQNHSWPSEGASDEELERERQWSREYSSDPTSATRLQAPHSASSSIDGYESFENTNNKKKRKIPGPGTSGGHSSNLSTDLANMGIASGIEPDGTGGGADQYYGSGSSAVSVAGSGTGISGAGRGRYGRSGKGVNQLRPLGASTTGLNAFANKSVSRTRADMNAVEGKAAQSQPGIISAAIANAAGQGPLTPAKGKENVSLLSQQNAQSSTPQKKEFTFTCESDTSNKIVWPGQNGAFATQSAAPGSYIPNSHTNMPKHQPRGGVAAQSTQTQASHQANPQQAAAANGQQVPHPEPARPRRSASKEYALQARQRQQRQQYNNWLNQTKREDIWVCEFCEYESIFGQAPKALIRQYEARDRAARKQEEERKRLLEKAKMKGRKGKKSGKNAKNAAANQQAQSNSQRYEEPLDDIPLPEGQQGEDYYDDEFDDEPLAPAPPSTARGGHANSGDPAVPRPDQPPGR
ncbi:MAG: hypothetical protein M1821_003057 [Bathelium mastoideum]|nr:MAG: hypothetical protein M1821_003057 [Bathelium mastoideum]